MNTVLLATNGAIITTIQTQMLLIALTYSLMGSIVLLLSAANQAYVSMADVQEYREIKTLYAPIIQIVNMANHALPQDVSLLSKKELHALISHYILIWIKMSATIPKNSYVPPYLEVPHISVHNYSLSPLELMPATTCSAHQWLLMVLHGTPQAIA